MTKSRFAHGHVTWAHDLVPADCVLVVLAIDRAVLNELAGSLVVPSAVVPPVVKGGPLRPEAVPGIRRAIGNELVLDLEQVQGDSFA